MMTFLIGHRGVGKSTLAKSLAHTKSVDVVDLDEKIESVVGDSISEIFAQQGEMRFRLLEQTTLQTVQAHVNRPTVIALGAGFQGPLPFGSRVVWLRRSTDRDGRIFLNRPRLNKEVGPLQEYLNLFGERERRYRQMATDILQIPEGYTQGLEGYFLPESSLNLRSELAGDLTLQNHQLNFDYIDRRKKWGVRRFELRTDLLSERQIASAQEWLKPEEIIFSVRGHGQQAPLNSAFVDWPLELGAPKDGFNIVSLHERRGSFLKSCEELSTYQEKGILKLAVEVQNFTELWQGHQWWLENKKGRAFLPNSTDGRWRWYRSLYGPHMPIHYFREDEGSSFDQPFLWQSVLQTQFDLSKGFAAVLGSPIHHSRTPMEHREFFASYGNPVVAIEINEPEWSDALAVLQKLGLKFAAVTSPLKDLANQNNTLILCDGKWQGTNTDIDGLKAMASGVQGPVALWGGGGTRGSVAAVFPGLQEFSARTGQPREGSPTSSALPETLIWAVGRNREFKWPPMEWPLKKIIDLNYSEASPGLELAALRGLAYQSGLEMFWAQAKAQRLYWQRYL